MSARLSDWEARLVAFVAENAARPYSPDWHCLLFIAGAVEAVTGEDHAAGVPRHKTMKSALAYLKRSGFDSPAVMVSAYLPAKRLGFAQRGDIVLADDGIPALCMGDYALSVTDEGLVRVPRADWREAWAV